MYQQIICFLQLNIRITIDLKTTLFVQGCILEIFQETYFC